MNDYLLYICIFINQLKLNIMSRQKKTIHSESFDGKVLVSKTDFDYLIRCKRSYQEKLDNKRTLKAQSENLSEHITRNKRMIDVWTKKSIEYYMMKVKGKATVKTELQFFSDNEYYSLRLSKQDMLLCSNYAKKIAGYKQYIK